MTVRVDASDATKKLGQIEAALSKPGLNRLGRKAKSLMDRSIVQTFSTATEPETGRAWAPRRHAYSHPPLVKTGTLRRSLKTASRAWVGRRASRLYLKFMWPDNKDDHIKAGALFWGRKRRRTSKGSKTRSASRTGNMPGRKFLGLSRGARRKLWVAARTDIRRVIGR